MRIRGNQECSGISCTTRIQAASLNHAPGQYEALNEALGGRRMVFVDTPGLNSMGGPDCVGLFEHIVQWLEARSVHFLISFLPVLNASPLVQLWEESVQRRRDVSLQPPHGLSVTERLPPVSQSLRRRLSIFNEPGLVA